MKARKILLFLTETPSSLGCSKVRCDVQKLLGAYQSSHCHSAYQTQCFNKIDIIHSLKRVICLFVCFFFFEPGRFSGRQQPHADDRLRQPRRLQHGGDHQHAAIRRPGPQDQEQTHRQRGPQSGRDEPAETAGQSLPTVSGSRRPVYDPSSGE